MALGVSRWGPSDFARGKSIARRKTSQDCRPGPMSERRPNRPMAFACPKRVVLAWVLLVLAATAWAQVSREYEIKAAYLYNFGRYVEWPEAAFKDAKAPFVIGVLGPAPVDEHLTILTRTKTLQDRPIQFVRHARVDDLKPCHILFISGQLEAEAQKQAAARFAGDPVLIVGEGDGFLVRGGSIEFRVVENKVRIRISLRSTQRSGMKPSAKLLQVAEVVD
jgi:hypothetical protein